MRIYAYNSRKIYVTSIKSLSPVCWGALSTASSRDTTLRIYIYRRFTFAGNNGKISGVVCCAARSESRARLRRQRRRGVERPPHTIGRNAIKESIHPAASCTRAQLDLTSTLLAKASAWPLASCGDDAMAYASFVAS